MDIAALSRDELEAFLATSLDASALAAGKVGHPFAVTRGKMQNANGWDHIGTAESPLITIELLEAAAFKTLAEFLRTAPSAKDVVRQVDRMLLDDAEVKDGGIATGFGAAFQGLAAAAVAVFLPDSPRFSLPPWTSRPPFPPIHRTRALEPDQVLFLHPTPTATYRVDPVAAIQSRGSEADLYLKAGVWRLRRQSRVPMTRFKIV